MNVHSLWASWPTHRAEYRAYADLGVTWVRTDVYWNALQPQSGGNFDPAYLGRVDEVVGSAHEVGLRQLLVVLGTPRWARPRGGDATSPPAQPRDYARAVAFLARRYEHDGVALEVWNEPNERRSFAQADPVAYAALACVADDAVKSVAPGVTVVAGALSGVDVAWLRRAHDAGLDRCYDVLSLHPYPRPPQRAGRPDPRWRPSVDLRALDVERRRARTADRPVWLTEFGWPTGIATDRRHVPERAQADYLRRFLDAVELDHDVAVAMVYAGRDDPTAVPRLRGYGVLRADLSPKPAARALRAFLSG